MKPYSLFFRQLLLTILITNTFNMKAQFYDWRLMNNNLTAYVQVPGSSNVVLAGDDNGLIRRSTDKGTTWKLVSYDVESGIKHFGFLDSLKGYASTNEGVYLITTDGGLTWKRLVFKDASNTLFFNAKKRIVIVDSVTAYFDGFNHPISAPTPKEALVTRDGGLTYNLVYCPGNVYHVAEDTLMAFGRESDFFGVAKFTIYQSIDKGLNWTIIKTSPTGLSSDLDFNGINLAYFLNSKTFYITAEKTIASDKKLYKTTDGGVTFTQVVSPANQKFDWVYFKNENEIMVIMQNGSGYTTTNGGSNWTQMSNNGKTPALRLTDGTLLTHNQTRSVISTNGGASWTIQSDLMYGLTTGTDMQYLKTVNDTLSYVAYGISTGTAVDPLLIQTKDGGLTWKQVKTSGGNQLSAHTYCVTSPDTFFYAVNGNFGNLEIRYTKDNGLTSQVKYTGTWQEKVKKMVSIDGKHIVAHGDMNNMPQIIFSTDSGQTWVKTNLSFAVTNYSIEFPTLNAWYVLHHGMVEKSTDQGQTWTNVTGTLPTGCISQIYFRDAQNGFAYGNCSSAKLFKTTNGGQTWVNIASNNSFTTMGFRTPTVGYASDPLVRTTDSGDNWSVTAHVQLVNSILKIDFADSTAGSMISQGYFTKYMGTYTFDTDTVSYTNSVSTSVNDITYSSFDFKLYPNPVNDVLTIVVDAKEPLLSVAITNVIGQQVYSSQEYLVNGKTQVAVNSFKPGIYFVIVETAQRTMTKKVVVRK